MSNATFRKDDGLLLVLPAGGITAVLSTKTAKSPQHPDATCVLFSTFRKTSVHHLGMTPADAFAAVSEKGEAGKDWLELPLLGDLQVIDPASVTGLEGVKLTLDGETEEREFLRVWFQRTDGVDVYTDADMDEALIPRITGLIRPASPAATADALAGIKRR